MTIRTIAILVSVLVLGVGLLVAAQEEGGRPQLDRLTLPPGFSIDVYAADVPNARQMALSPNGTLFVSTRRAGNVYAVLDDDGDQTADRVLTLASGLNMPNGVAFRDGALYVAEVNRVWRYDDIEANLESPPEPVIVNDSFPSDRAHGWKFIAFGPDDRLYVPVGAPCNVCDHEAETPIYSTITSMNPDGSDLQIYAHGIRNSVGFSWHPETDELWFTNNGRDRLGDTQPADTLHHAPEPGLHFGFPFCHQGDIQDPEFNTRPCSEFRPPARKLGPHVAALGMRFYTGGMFPSEYRNQIFIAEHGSWNRSAEAGHIGYRITVATLDGDRVTDYSIFAEGWLDTAINDSWGRPVDVQVMPDGALLITDDQVGAIYRITYDG
ncbi:MAG: sorbosone dehydrogenase family protein [Acidobacteria bacterium]|nr:sorbosone dehydrogenase family protein [Acidobacteriota bacterium]MYD69268.1 sorbosone dehydrogenase family protein [Acidobacteriota bacterium]MYJ04726.1 sorbosone dehydrogenase family protein [Acidobacteriota bacterium]